MKLKKCKTCGAYTLREVCKKCGEKTNDAHYKFLHLKDAPKSNIEIVRRK